MRGHYVADSLIGLDIKVKVEGEQPLGFAVVLTSDLVFRLLKRELQCWGSSKLRSPSIFLGYDGSLNLGVRESGQANVISALCRESRLLSQLFQSRGWDKGSCPGSLGSCHDLSLEATN